MRVEEYNLHQCALTSSNNRPCVDYDSGWLCLHTLCSESRPPQSVHCVFRLRAQRYILAIHNHSLYTVLIHNHSLYAVLIHNHSLYAVLIHNHSLTLGVHAPEGYSTWSVCLSVCLCVCVCVFSLFWHLAQSGVQTAVSATSARYGHEI